MSLSMSAIRIHRSDERGLVSFMITIVMMVVISLIVVGFTQVANRNRRQSLDRQLSTQAFYAAESGVNDAVTAINALPAGNPIPSQTDCSGSDYPATTINTEPLVRYTCVLVSSTVPDITVPPTTQASSVVPIKPTDSDGNPLSATELTFSWLAAAGQSTDPSLCSLPGVFRTTASETCGYALLRVDLLRNSGQTSAAALAGSTATFYMQPVRSGSAASSVSDFSAPKAHTVAASCSSATGRCTATLLLSGTASYTSYVARISGLYREPRGLVVDGKSGATNTWFGDAQAIIDVTGKAQDVLRRIKVRVPLHDMGGSNIPSGGIHSSSTVCKRFTASATMYQPEDPIACP
jgi:Tfp pilus assembly protein PilX